MCFKKQKPKRKKKKKRVVKLNDILDPLFRKWELFHFGPRESNHSARVHLEVMIDHYSFRSSHPFSGKTDDNSKVMSLLVRILVSCGH